MKITKYQHACFSVEIDGKLLIVDPGNFTTDLEASDNVAVIVITHEHPDHFDLTAIDAIVSRNPHAVIVAPAVITSQLKTAPDAFSYITATPGDVIEQAPFSLAIFGGQHAIIHPDIPQLSNIAVMVNDVVFYPGDSFTVPDVSVPILALPVSAPWLKISEVIDYVRNIAPNQAFPTHDAILSDAGKQLIDRLLPPFAASVGTQYKRINDAPLEYSYVEK